MQFSKTLVILFLASMAAAAPLASGDMRNSKRNALATSSHTPTAHGLSDFLMRREINNNPESQRSIQYLSSLSSAQVDTLMDSLNNAQMADIAAIKKADPKMFQLLDDAYDILAKTAEGKGLSAYDAALFFGNLKVVRSYMSGNEASFPKLEALFATLDAEQIGA